MNANPADQNTANLLKQLIEAQQAHTKALLSTRQEPDQMTRAQASVAQRFLAFRNALGSIGRRGGPADVALMPSPTLRHNRDGTFDLTFAAGTLPADAAFVIASYRDGPDEEFDLATAVAGPDGTRTLPDVGEVIGAQVDAADHLPLRFAIPLRVEAVGPGAI